MTNDKRPQVFREATPEVIATLRGMVAAARHAAMATLEPETGFPLATRVGLTTLADGTPLVFVSMLAAHTPALLADPRASLLIGEVGRGDPVAHPRATLYCRAEQIARQSPEGMAALERILASNPKARLYAGLPDFMLFALSVEHATYNGGFGKAFRVSGAEYYGGQGVAAHP
ncbi:MAG: pyridoxamine 5'-phosphate oxidase family protein [Alphaproteobacteria bacterium]|nr:pyridoxamine 5'-phosphate oxidase family protein [Alphaproteobacteria bacterium]